MALTATNDAAPSTTRTYEVQRHSQGRWMVDSVTDDKDVAIEMAKSLMNGRRPPSGARVMAVELKDTGKFSEISVYRSTMADQSRDEAQPAKPKIEATAKANNETRDFKQGGRPQAPAKEKESGIKSLIRSLQLIFGLAATAAALEALHLLMMR
jgi:hypothetical protein